MEAFNTERGVFGTKDNGGGIFSTGVGGLGGFSGLGAMPYMAFSEETLSLQTAINAIADSVPTPKVTEDGVLGPGTCAAVKAIIKSGKYSTWKLPAACASGSSSSTTTTSTTSSTKPATALPASYTGGSSNKTGILIAVAAAVAVLGGYWAYKKYGK